MITLPTFTYADLIPIVAAAKWEGSQHYYFPETLENAVVNKFNNHEDFLKAALLADNKMLAQIAWKRLHRGTQTQFLYRLLTQEPISDISLESVTKPEHSLALLKRHHLDLLKKEIDHHFEATFSLHDYYYSTSYRGRFKKSLDAFLNSAETYPSLKGVKDYHEKKFLMELRTLDPYRLQKLALDIAIQEQIEKQGSDFSATAFLTDPVVKSHINQRFTELSDKFKKKHEAHFKKFFHVNQESGALNQKNTWPQYALDLLEWAPETDHYPTRRSIEDLQNGFALSTAGMPEDTAPSMKEYLESTALGSEIGRAAVEQLQEKMKEEKENPAFHENPWKDLRKFSSKDGWRTMNLKQDSTIPSDYDNLTYPLEKLQFIKDIQTNKSLSDKEKVEVVKDRIHQFKSSKESRTAQGELLEAILPFLPQERENIDEIILLLSKIETRKGESLQSKPLRNSGLNKALLRMTLGPEADILQPVSVLLSNVLGWKFPDELPRASRKEPLDLESALLNPENAPEQWKPLLDNAPLLSMHLDVLTKTLWLDRSRPASEEKISLLLNHSDQASQAMVRSMLFSQKDGEGISDAVDWLSTHAPLASSIALEQLLTSSSSLLFERNQRARELRGIRTIGARHPEILVTPQASGHTPLAQAVVDANSNAVQALLSRSAQKQLNHKTSEGGTVWQIMLDTKRFLPGLLRFSHTVEPSALSIDDKWADGMPEGVKKKWEGILSRTHPHIQEKEAPAQKPRSTTQKKWDDLLISLWRQDKPIGALEAEASRRGINREKQENLRRTPLVMAPNAGRNSHLSMIPLRVFVSQRLPSLNDRLWDEQEKKEFNQASVHDWLEKHNPKCLKKPGEFHTELKQIKASTRQLEQKNNLERTAYMEHKDRINSNWKKVKP